MFASLKLSGLVSGYRPCGGLVEALDLVFLALGPVILGVLHQLDFAAAACSGNKIPVHLHLFAMLALANGGEEFAQHTLTAAVQEQIVCDSRFVRTIAQFDLQHSLVAGRQLAVGARRMTCAFEALYLKIAVAGGKQDKR